MWGIISFNSTSQQLSDYDSYFIDEKKNLRHIEFKKLAQGNR